MKKRKGINHIVMILFLIVSLLLLCFLLILLKYPFYYQSKTFFDLGIIKSWPESFLEQQRSLRKKLKIYPKQDQQTRLHAQNRRINQIRLTIFDPFLQGYELKHNALPSSQSGHRFRPLKRKAYKSQQGLKGLYQLILDQKFSYHLVEGIFLSQKSQFSLQRIPRKTHTRYLRFDILPLEPTKIKFQLGGMMTDTLSFLPSSQPQHCDFPIHETQIQSLNLTIEKGATWIINPEITVTLDVAKKPIIYNQEWDPSPEKKALDPETSFEQMKELIDPLVYQQQTPPEKGEELKAIGYNLLWFQISETITQEKNPKDWFPELNDSLLVKTKRISQPHESFLHTILNQNMEAFDLPTLSLSLKENQSNLYQKLRQYAYYVGSLGKIENFRMEPLFQAIKKKSAEKNWKEKSQAYEFIDFKNQESYLVKNLKKNYLLHQLFNLEKWLAKQQKKRFALHMNFDTYPFSHEENFQNSISQIPFLGGKGIPKNQPFQTQENIKALLNQILNNLHGLYLTHRTILVLQMPLKDHWLFWIKFPGLKRKKTHLIEMEKTSNLSSKILSAMGLPESPSQTETFTKFKLSLSRNQSQEKEDPMDLTLIWHSKKDIQHADTNSWEWFDLVGQNQFLFWPFQQEGFHEVTWYQKTHSIEEDFLNQKEIKPSWNNWTNFMGGSLLLTGRRESSFPCHLDIQIGPHLKAFDPLLAFKLSQNQNWWQMYQPLEKLKIHFKDPPLNHSCKIGIQLSKGIIRIPS